MPRGRVLIIEDDEWVSALLAKFLRDEDYLVDTAIEAQEGFQKACELLPDCIICDVSLPDIDGFWVARKVRTERSRLATTPFLFLSSADDTASRLQGLNVGADMYLTKPFRHQEVVAQVGALIDMADRLSEQRDSFMHGPVSSKSSPAFRGDLSQLSVSTVFTLLEMERRTGHLKVRDESGRTLEFRLFEGGLVGVLDDDKPIDAIAAIREVVALKVGRLWFRPADVADPGADTRKSIGMLLLEAVRLEDESAR